MKKLPQLLKSLLIFSTFTLMAVSSVQAGNAAYRDSDGVHYPGCDGHRYEGGVHVHGGFNRQKDDRNECMATCTDDQIRYGAPGLAAICVDKPKAGYGHGLETHPYTYFKNCDEDYEWNGTMCQLKAGKPSTYVNKCSTKTEAYTCKIAGIKTKNGCLRTRTECNDCRDGFTKEALSCSRATIRSTSHYNPGSALPRSCHKYPSTYPVKRGTGGGIYTCSYDQ